MTIVARGLGLGGGSILVAFGTGRDKIALEQLADIIISSSVEQISNNISAFAELSQLTDSGALVSAKIDRLDSNTISISVSSSTNSQIIALADVESLNKSSAAHAMLSLQDQGINVEALIQKVSENSGQSSSVEDFNQISSSISGVETTNSDSNVNVTIQEIPNRNVNSVSSVKKLNDDISST
jgi:hypothetical protein